MADPYQLVDTETDTGLGDPDNEPDSITGLGLGVSQVVRAKREATSEATSEWYDREISACIVGETGISLGEPSVNLADESVLLGGGGPIRGEQQLSVYMSNPNPNPNPGEQQLSVTSEKEVVSKQNESVNMHETPESDVSENSLIYAKKDTQTESNDYTGNQENPEKEKQVVYEFPISFLREMIGSCADKYGRFVPSWATNPYPPESSEVIEDADAENREEHTGHRNKKQLTSGAKKFPMEKILFEWLTSNLKFSTLQPFDGSWGSRALGRSAVEQRVRDHSALLRDQSAHSALLRANLFLEIDRLYAG